MPNQQFIIFGGHNSCLSILINFFTHNSCLSILINFFTSQEAKEAEERAQRAEMVPEPEYTEADIPRLQEEVNELQAKFDASVVTKHSLEMELQASNERLKAATNMIRR